jgi:hypothetical protein
MPWAPAAAKNSGAGAVEQLHADQPGRVVRERIERPRRGRIASAARKNCLWPHRSARTPTSMATGTITTCAAAMQADIRLVRIDQRAGRRLRQNAGNGRDRHHDADSRLVSLLLGQQIDREIGPKGVAHIRKKENSRHRARGSPARYGCRLPGSGLRVFPGLTSCALQQNGRTSDLFQARVPPIALEHHSGVSSAPINWFGGDKPCCFVPSTGCD